MRVHQGVCRKIREVLADTPPPEYPAQNPPPSVAPSKMNKQCSRIVPPRGGKRGPTGSPIRVDQEPLPERPAPVEERPKDSRDAQEPAVPSPNPSLPFSAATWKHVHDGGPRPQPKAPAIPFQRVGLPVGPQKPLPKPLALGPCSPVVWTTKDQERWLCKSPEGCGFNPCSSPGTIKARLGV